jgi:hypothetical protein
LCLLPRAGFHFSPVTGIAVLVSAKGFHWTICTLFSVSFFTTERLCLSSIAHFAVPFYIISHFHNSTLSPTLTMQYIPLSHWYPSTTLHCIKTHTSTYDYHFLAVYCAHSSLYHTTVYRNCCLKNVQIFECTFISTANFCTLDNQWAERNTPINSQLGASIL